MFSGGTKGNEQLTAQLGLVLLIMLAAIGVTIPDLRGLIAEHLFLGFLLIGPVVAKMGSTGYRFVRYYTRDPAYRRKGPPQLGLRSDRADRRPIHRRRVRKRYLADDRGPQSQKSRAHGPQAELHRVGRLHGSARARPPAEMPRSLRGARETRAALAELSPQSGDSPAVSSGTRGRWVTLTASTVAGAVAAIALIPSFSSWTARGVFRHHHKHEASAVVPAHTRAAVTSHIRPRVTRG